MISDIYQIMKLSFTSMNTNKILLVSSTVVIVFALVFAPMSMTESVFAKKHYKNWNDCREDHSKNWCKKYFKKHNNDNDKGGNKASQGIGQSQSSHQNSQVVSGGDSVGSGNNINLQNQINTGNNALAQQ
jgi:hypothetical protein